MHWFNYSYIQRGLPVSVGCVVLDEQSRYPQHWGSLHNLTSPSFLCLVATNWCQLKVENLIWIKYHTWIINSIFRCINVLFTVINVLIETFNFNLRIFFYLGSPPNSHSAQIYGPGRNITNKPWDLAVSMNSLKIDLSQFFFIKLKF